MFIWNYGFGVDRELLSSSWGEKNSQPTFVNAIWNGKYILVLGLHTRITALCSTLHATDTNNTNYDDDRESLCIMKTETTFCF